MTGQNIKNISLVISSLIFIYSIMLMIMWDSSIVGYQWVIELYFLNTYLLLGIDSISMAFILLVSLIIPLCLIFNIQLNNTYDTNKYFFNFYSVRNIITISV